MSSSTINIGKTVSIRLVLVVPFVLQVFAAVAVTGWLSLRNGQQAVNDVATQLRSEKSERIKQQFLSYLDEPNRINRPLAKKFCGDILLNLFEILKGFLHKH